MIKYIKDWNKIVKFAYMNNTRLHLFAALALILCSCAPKQESFEQLTERVMDLAVEKYIAIDQAINQTEVTAYPRSTNPDGNLRTSDMGWWCSGFYPGSLWLIYEHTANEEIKALAEKYTLPLAQLKDRNTDHDIGFQINCSFGNGLRLTADEEKYAQAMIDGAQKLALRFSDNTGTTKSWNFLRKAWKYPVIIDNMMNLELLTVAHRMSGDERLLEVALAHARTTMKNHFRDDWSCYHLVDYDPETGEVRSRETVQGYADESLWARGQAWALYGFTMMYRETDQQEFHDAAVKIADRILAELPEDGMPYWDFDAPEIPNANRDASACAIMASAFAELGYICQDGAKGKTYIATADKQVRTLASETYLAAKGENGDFLIKHCVGNIPENSEVDVPLSYADYYFIEAINRLNTQYYYEGM